MQTDKPAVLCFTASAEETAARVASTVEGQLLLRGRDFEDVAETARSLFAARRPLIGVCASGILIRALAPMLGDKWTEPPVISVAEDGSSAAPLLGGHRGANRLAVEIAAALQGKAAITTASDLSLGVALDDPPNGWRLVSRDMVKPVTAALLGGGKAQVLGDGAWADQLRAALGADAAPEPSGAVSVRADGGLAEIVYRQQNLVLGVGCARGADPEEAVDLARRTLAAVDAPKASVACVASIDLKSDEAAVHAVAAFLDVPARFFPAERLEAETPRLANPSEVVFAEVGCHGVAEGAALASVGPEGRLLVEKRKTANVTCALAEAPLPLTEPPGGARGRLSVVGVGPGWADWRTPEASRLVADAQELVGYGLYIDLLGPLGAGKPRQDFPLGGEEDRCRHALERAGEGRNVALICSGDAGIYAMGALVMELMDRPTEEGGVSAEAKRVEIINAPGVSALQAASARAGALLGHDFCAISLSDLLTPRDQIVKRLHAAAEGDFVIAFYNPVSKRRRTLLAEAREILLKHRPAETPVLLASNLGRPGETLRRRTLSTLEVDEVDMLTVVLVGASQSRAFATGDRSAGAEGSYIYTPRGYARKIDGDLSE
ncbi:MAG: precorrin-3B C(17)-methyltransferase [Pseudomonadota bacterium]